MAEEMLLDAEEYLSTNDVAERLRDIAEQLETGDELTVEIAGETVTVPAPDGTIEFEVEVEREHENEYELELEIEWTVA